MHILSKPLLSAGPVGIIANRRVEVKIEQKPNLRSACKDALPPFKIFQGTHALNQTVPLRSPQFVYANRSTTLGVFSINKGRLAPSFVCGRSLRPSPLFGLGDGRGRLRQRQDALRQLVVLHVQNIALLGALIGTAAGRA